MNDLIYQKYKIFSFLQRFNLNILATLKQTLENSISTKQVLKPCT